MDDFWPFVVKGWIDPNLPEAAHQNHVLGGAAATSAMTLAEGGYTVVVDGHVFPDALPQLQWACRTRAIPLHYVVLRTELATCTDRVAGREGTHEYEDGLGALHARYVGLGDHEANVIDSSGPPEDVADAVLSAYAVGTLRVS